MAHELDIVAATGFDPSDPQKKKLLTSRLPFPYDDFEGGDKGFPITREFGRKLVKLNCWPWLDNDEVASITFDYRPITLLLSQKKCVGIRFYFAATDNEKQAPQTLVLVGIDKFGNDLGLSEDNEEMPVQDPNDPCKTKYKSMFAGTDETEKSLIFEVGGGNLLCQFK